MTEERSWLFFDIGSTLVDETAAYDRHALMMNEKSGVSFSDFDRKRREFYRKGIDGNSAAKEYFSLPDIPWPSEEERVYPDAYDTLRFLKECGYSLGVIANQPEGTERRLKKYGLFDFFSVIAASYECGFSKPDSRIFLKALDAAGCRAEDAWMIGDRLDNDIIPSHNLGFGTVWMRSGMWRLTEEEYIPSCIDYTIDKLSSLRDNFHKIRDIY